MSRRNMLSMIGILIVGLGCSLRAATKTEPSPLIGEFVSFESPAEVKARFMLQHLSWTHKRESRADARYPRYEWLVLEVPSFRYNDCQGAVEFHFFNDRLMQTLFFPSKPCLLPSLQSKAQEHVGKPTKLRVAQDIQGREYLAWIDERLEKENESWLRRWS